MTRTVEVTHSSKILFPEAKITKGEFVAYYESIAPLMLHYAKSRLVVMHRYPNGIDHEGFYHKDIPDYFPKWIARKKVKRKEGGYVTYAVIKNEATIVYLANQVCITPHLWLSKEDKLNYPDRLIFDLDPSKKGFALVQKVARYIKDLLDELEMPNFVMLTGSRGVHIYIPLKRTHTFDYVREFAHDMATYIAYLYPRDATVEVRKTKRRGRIFIDWLRNAFGATGVAPYAVRARKGAPIATPIEWKELWHKSMTPDKYTIKTINKRLAQKKDPWSVISKSACSLKKARKKLDQLLEELE